MHDKQAEHMIIIQKSLRDGNVNTRKVLKQTTAKDSTADQKNRASNSIYSRLIVNQSVIKRLRSIIRSVNCIVFAFSTLLFFNCKL